MFTLDYTLNLPQRLQLVQQLELNSLSPHQLDFLASYLLWAVESRRAQLPTSTGANAPTELGEWMEASNPTHDTNSTTAWAKPRRKLDPLVTEPWDESKALIKQKMEALKALDSSNDSFDGPSVGSQLKLLRNWSMELSQDATLAHFSAHPPTEFSCTPSPTPPPTLDELDYSDSFHIKHLIEFYSQLKQSSNLNAQYSAMWLEHLIDTCPSLKPWERDLVVLRIDGKKSPAIATYMHLTYGRNLSPQSQSTAMRTIYRSIAEWNSQLQWERANPNSKRICTKCGEEKFHNEYYFHVGRAECKACRTKKHNPNTPTKPTQALTPEQKDWLMQLWDNGATINTLEPTDTQPLPNATQLANLLVHMRNSIHPWVMWCGDAPTEASEWESRRELLAEAAKPHYLLVLKVDTELDRKWVEWVVSDERLGKLVRCGWVRRKSDDKPAEVMGRLVTKGQGPNTWADLRGRKEVAKRWIKWATAQEEMGAQTITMCDKQAALVWGGDKLPKTEWGSLKLLVHEHTSKCKCNWSSDLGQTLRQKPTSAKRKPIENEAE